MDLSFSTAPALRYVILFSAGILLALIISVPLRISIILLLSVCLLILLCRRKKCSDRLFMVCILFSGILRCVLAEEQFINTNMLEKEVKDLKIIILQQKTTPYYITSYLAEARIDDRICRGTLYARPNMGVMLPGKSYYLSSASLRPVRADTNPYRFNYLEYAKGKGISHAFYTDSKVVVQEGKVEHPLRYAAYCVRERISVRFLAVLGIEKGSLVNGLLLGMKSEIPAAVSGMFRNLGISHLLAVSGLHVGLIVLIFYQLLLTMSLTRVPRTICIIAFLIFYCYLTGGSPSVIRSSLMTGMLLLAPVFQRRYQAMNAVAATALILLLINPFYLRDVGFQFSFSAVFGILTGYGILKQKIPFRPANPVGLYAWDMLMVSISAALFTAPVALFYFNTLQVASLFLNIIAIPLTFCVMICALLSIPCLFVPCFISDLILHALDLSLGLMRGMLRLASRSGIWTLDLSSYWKPLIMGLLLMLVVSLCVNHKRTRLMICTILFVISGVWFFLSTRPEIVQLSLQRGQSILYRNGRKALIINTGAVRFGGNDYHSCIQPVCRQWGIRDVTVVISAQEKSKTGTIFHILRDYPGSTVMIPCESGEEESKYQIVCQDSVWRMGKHLIRVSPENEGRLSLMIRTGKDSLMIAKLEDQGSNVLDPDAETEQARHAKIFLKRIYWK